MPARNASGIVADVTPDELLSVRELTVCFSDRGKQGAAFTAVDKVSLSIRRAEVLGLVGESGSGKTTLGRAILRLVPTISGRIVFENTDITHLTRGALRSVRKRMQMVFQDPFSSLHPRHTVGATLAEPLRIHDLASRNEARESVRRLLATVGLNPQCETRYPHELSGGQRQRVCIARALALNPSFIVADEPLSALDVSVQAQIVRLLQQLRQTGSLSLLFVSHDLAVVRYLSDRIGVMYRGRIVETATTEELFAAPAHPYTVALMSSVPGLGSPRPKVAVQTNSNSTDPTRASHACRFADRCWLRKALGSPANCLDSDPALRAVANGGHSSACHHAAEVPRHLEPAPPQL